MSLYATAVRPLLFALSPDRSHALATLALRWAAPWQALGAVARLGATDPRLRVRYAGVELPAPVGLAAGFDKNAEMMAALSALGFGFVTVGSLMAEPRFGNPFPRLVRYPEARSLADAMGLPSKGIGHAAQRLARFHHHTVPVFANVAGFTADAVVAGVTAAAPHADIVELNLLCPNIQPGEQFDEMAFLHAVMDRLQGLATPVTVRVPNDTVASDDRLAEFLERCIALGVRGVKIGGGRPVAEPRLGTGRGTLHGEAVFEAALGNVARAARCALGRLDIKGNGGVSSAAALVRMMQAGACCVDLYSAFIYQGWGIAARIHRDLLRMMEDGRAPLPGRLSAAAG